MAYYHDNLGLNLRRIHACEEVLDGPAGWGGYGLAAGLRRGVVYFAGLYSHIWNLQRNACGTSLEKHLKQQLWLIF